MISGDWVAFAKCSSAFNSLGFFCGDVGANIKGNHQILLNSWGGHAANASYNYFRGVSSSLDNHKEALEGLRDNYKQAAQGMWEFSKMVGDLIQGIFDKLFWIGVEAAAGAILAETVVGPALLWSVAAVQCAQVVHDWETIVKHINQIQQLLRGVHGGILTILGSSGGFKAHPLPASSYQHPAVK